MQWFPAFLDYDSHSEIFRLLHTFSKFFCTLFSPYNIAEKSLETQSLLPVWNVTSSGGLKPC